MSSSVERTGWRSWLDRADRALASAERAMGLAVGHDAKPAGNGDETNTRKAGDGVEKQPRQTPSHTVLCIEPRMPPFRQAGGNDAATPVPARPPLAQNAAGKGVTTTPDSEGAAASPTIAQAAPAAPTVRTDSPPATQPTAASPPPPPPAPVIAILLDGPPALSAGFNQETAPVYVAGGRTMAYAEAVEEGGGTVRWIWDDGKSPERHLEGVHGLLIPGGRDVHPEMYGEPPDPSFGLNLAPLKFDMWQCQMMSAAMKLHIPIRGICRGMQLLNIIGNGTLMQDIRRHIDRPWKYTLNHQDGKHVIAVIPSSRLGKIMPKQAFFINSSHHQGIAKLSDQYESAATAADGVTEAIEKRDAPNVLGVQFHPERAEAEIRRPFFRDFIEDAHRYRDVISRQVIPAAWRRPANPKRAPIVPQHPPVPRVTTASAPAAAPPADAPQATATSRETPVTVANVPKRERYLMEGVAELTVRGYQVVFGSNGDVIHTQNVHELKNMENLCVRTLKHHQVVGTMYGLSGQNVESLLLSLTDVGRRFLHPKTLRVLEHVREAKKIADTTLTSDVFAQKTGWLPWSRSPVKFEIEAVWACFQGKLFLKYGNREIRLYTPLLKHSPDAFDMGLDEFGHALREMKAAFSSKH